MFKSLMQQAQQREDGQGLVEYALILVLVAVVVIVVLSLVGPAVGNIFSEVVDALNGAAEGDTSEIAGTECLWDTNVYYSFPVGADQISEPITRYDDADCSVNPISISPPWQYMFRSSQFSSTAEAQAACDTAMGTAGNILEAGEVVYCRA